jgi:hypothetical protein
MYARLCTFFTLLLAGLALSACASYAPYPCPPGYHLGPYGRRCLANVGAYYPPPPPGYAPPAGYAPPGGPPPPSGYPPPPASEYGPPASSPRYSSRPENPQ